MKSSRLLSLLMHLQSRSQQLSASVLAREMGVSVRTIYRDVAALEASGVPLVVTHGAQGGFALLEGWRTRLTGLTADEAQAVLLAGLPGPARELGLGEAAASAQLKMLAALPSGWQAQARQVSDRFHLDPMEWYREGARLEFLPQVAQAVWSAQVLAVRYESWKGVVERELQPLGLVLKAGHWYLVATAAGSARREPRTYRLSNLRALAVPGPVFERPRDFDLAHYWAQSTARFERELVQQLARVRVNGAGVKVLRQLGNSLAQAVDAASPDTTDPATWHAFEIPIESIAHSARLLLRLGADCEVLTPPELRAAMLAEIAAMSARYAPADVNA